MVYPKVSTIGKLPDIVIIQLFVMGYPYIAENYIMSRTICLIICLKVHVIKRVSTIASDDGFIWLHIDYCVFKTVTPIAVLSIRACFADVLCYDDSTGIGTCTSSFELIKILYFYNFSECSSYITSLYSSAHIL